ncbi:unnamed protein product [Aureobasidium uvarum]|uniref:Mitochondrial pyruvate carrier n=1 Tax=Aureobasidium uvarum TaxID=2773716 RepID=A0A9N8KGP9_9PEZI|nr:unnamed protein product [Aureobasidium uvarum]
MAAAIKALNAKIRSNPYTDYLCSTRECSHEDKTRTLRCDQAQSPASCLALACRQPYHAHTDMTCSAQTFWGPASNFGIPLAAVMDTQKDPEM